MKKRLQSISDVLGRSPVHPFPARMAATVALNAIANARTPLRVLDPMMGSGTVLALARSKGHFARGVDIDPLAVLISRVWNTAIDKGAVREKADEVLKRAIEKLRLSKKKYLYPYKADRETKKFARYWFDLSARKELACLAEQIRLCRNATIKDALWCAFSRLIIAKQAGASLALDLSHSRPHRFFKTAPRKPFDNFLNSVEQVLDSCLSTSQRKIGPTTTVSKGDARDLSIKANSVDLVLTSPPYLNAIDYIRCSKFSLIWMGHSAGSLRDVRSISIGTEIGRYEEAEDDPATSLLKSLRIHSRLSARHKALLRRYICDMSEVLSEVSRVLVPGGAAIFVVGENAIRGTYIRNSKIILKLATDAGLLFSKKTTRTLPPNRRYLPPPTDKRGSINLRMRQEVVMTFIKPIKKRSR